VDGKRGKPWTLMSRGDLTPRTRDLISHKKPQVLPHLVDGHVHERLNPKNG